MKGKPDLTVDSILQLIPDFGTIREVQGKMGLVLSWRSIGGRLFPLPRRTKWETKDAFGEETRNASTFENCHEFVGESVLKFGDTDPPPAGK